jgi:tetratricopeptide (TPR) repeat protein
MDSKLDLNILLQAMSEALGGEVSQAITSLDQHPFSPYWAPFGLILQARLVEENDLGGAWALYQQALADFPTNPSVWLRAGVSSYKRGDIVRAKELLLQSWELSPTAEAAYYLGLMSEEAGRDERATHYFVQAILLEGSQGTWAGKSMEVIERGV